MIPAHRLLQALRKQDQLLPRWPNLVPHLQPPNHRQRPAVTRNPIAAGLGIKKSYPLFSHSLLRGEGISAEGERSHFLFRHLAILTVPPLNNPHHLTFFISPFEGEA